MIIYMRCKSFHFSFMRQLIAATNVSTKKFHLIGHSLGAHICSYIASQLGGVARITGMYFNKFNFEMS